MSAMRCAIYSRVSLDTQSQNSIADQIRECERFAKHSQWTIVSDHIYRDAAVSGSDVNRFAYTRLKQAAMLNEFDCILVDDLSRLGRDMAESVMVFQELSSIGVRIVGVSDGIDTSNPSAKIPYYFKGIMNEVFLDDLKAKVIRGLKGQVIRGYSAGGRVYGYKTKQVLDPTGAKDKFDRPKRIGCEVLVDKQQAKVVQKIFELAKSGFGYRSIAEYLNKEGVPSPHAGSTTRSGYWGRSTVHSILSQRKYLGTWTWNKTKWLRGLRGTKRIKQTRPESEWVVYRGEKLRIVSDGLWDAVHREKRSGHAGNRGRRGKYLLSGILRCANCNSSMVVQNSGKYSCYICNGYRNGGRPVCPNNHRITRHVVERAFFDEIKTVFMNPTILASLKSKVQASIEAHLASRRETLDSLRSQKTQVERQLENLIKFVESGDHSQTIRDRIAEKESELCTIQGEAPQDLQNAKIKPTVTVDWIEAKLNNLKGIIEAGRDSIGLLKQEIKNLFPEGLVVTQTESDQDIIFKINGTAKPFSSTLLPVSIMSHSGTGNRTPV